VLYAIKQDPKYMFVPVVVALLQKFLHGPAPGEPARFQSRGDEGGPSEHNPMDNPLPYDEAPLRPRGDYEEEREAQNRAATSGIFRDVGDVYAEQANSRSYYPVPQNDQRAFAEALFGEVGSFRAGIGCDGSLLTERK